MTTFKSQALCQVLIPSKRKAEVTSYDLAKRWDIGLETAKRTLLKTTQRDEELPQILCCLNSIVQMIECLGTGGYLLNCLLTLLRQGLFHTNTGEINMPKLMPTGTHDARHT